MIRNDQDHDEAVKRLLATRAGLTAQAHQLRGTHLEENEIQRALQPLQSFVAGMEEEIDAYERSKQGLLDAVEHLSALGRSLVAFRIARGLTQRELAQRLGVHESQVSRDERNEYHGITVDRASRILEALGVDLRCTFRPRSDEAGRGVRG